MDNKWYEAKVPELQVGAEAGDPDAMYHLALRYRKGREVPQDLPRAVEWLLRAADLGHAHAQSSMGVRYYYGEGVPKNHRLAMKWWGDRLEGGDPAAGHAAADGDRVVAVADDDRLFGGVDLLHPDLGDRAEADDPDGSIGDGGVPVGRQQPARSRLGDRRRQADSDDRVPVVDRLDPAIVLEWDLGDEVMGAGGDEATDGGVAGGYPLAGGDRHLARPLHRYLEGGGNKGLGQDAQDGTFAGREQEQCIAHLLLLARKVCAVKPGPRIDPAPSCPTVRSCPAPCSS